MATRQKDAKVTRTIAIDPEILGAAESYAIDVVKESTNTVIQRALREFLERNDAWPVKPVAKKKAGA